MYKNGGNPQTVLSFVTRQLYTDCKNTTPQLTVNDLQETASGVNVTFTIRHTPPHVYQLGFTKKHVGLHFWAELERIVDRIAEIHAAV